jgi:carbon-monoxide dehydrogenase medium subunit
LLTQFGGGATVYCGGTELLQVMKMGLASFDHLIDLKGIDGLRRIDVGSSGELSIGAAVTHREIEQSAAIRAHLPGLADLERHVANVRVRNSGSLGGNLCFAEPHSDPATFLIAIGASVRLRNASETRRLPLAEFILGPFQTAIQSDEVLEGIDVPPLGSSTFVAYQKIAFRERPVASVAVRFTVTDAGIIRSPVLVVGAVGESALAAAAAPFAETALTAVGDLIPLAADAAAAGCDAGSDLHGSEDYQRHLVGVLAKRALIDAVSRARTHVPQVRT